MFHIDISHLGSKVDNLEVKKIDERVYNNRFENFIIDEIHKKQCNVSSCFLNNNIETKVPRDNRVIVEVLCNGLLTCHFCEIPKDLEIEIFPEDFIIVRNEECQEICQVKLVGELVSIKRQSLGLFCEKLPLVIRKASAEDIGALRKNYQDEERALPIFQKSVEKYNLNMKLVSIHYQFDRKKLFFFYTSDGRVDFRELAKELASEFKTRIELRQIGVRDEAKKIGGVGTCGREYCCISFLSNFKRITTQLATEQNLLSSMGKLSGPCGKLKCCLSFEVE